MPQSASINYVEYEYKRKNERKKYISLNDIGNIVQDASTI